MTTVDDKDKYEFLAMIEEEEHRCAQEVTDMIN